MSREIVLKDDAFLVSETNSKGIITFANQEFCDAAQYSLDELLNQNHNIVRHQDMPKGAFKDLWETVQKGKVWQGYVKNRTKTGGFYWVHATVYPFKNEKGEQCYMSCRRKPSQDKIIESEALYKTLR